MRSALQSVIIVFLCVAGVLAPMEVRSEINPVAWDKSVVHLDVTRKQYDYTQPWTKKVKKSQKVGLVLDGNEILTTADEMFDRTLIRIQKGGRGKWWLGKVSWIDYHSNLAVVTCQEDGFWEGLKPADFSDKSNPGDLLQIVRWREGKLESRRAEFNQFTVDDGHLSFVPQVQLEMSSEIQGAGWGEPVISNSKIIAIISEHTGGKCTAIPSSFFLPILKARKAGDYRGLGYFDFYWQPAENTTSLSHLKLDGEPRGVIINDVFNRSGSAPTLKSKDVLIEVDGFQIDIQGDYTDPDYGPLSLENLATREKWAGDDLKMKVLRDGKLLDITYRLRKADYSATLVPDAAYDQEPEYLIVGGLVFQPLNDPYLQSWGPDWKRRSPFRLYYYNNQDQNVQRPSLLFLSQVLPDPYNIGYQELRHLVLDEVNGQKIATLPELYEALKKPINGFHHIQFMLSDTMRKIVLGAEGHEPATQRVLQRYGIPQPYVFSTPSPAKTASASTATTAGAGTN